MVYSASTHGAVAMRAGPGKMKNPYVGSTSNRLYPTSFLSCHSYDNKAPRTQIAAGEITDPLAARALALNQNLTEGFPIILTAVFIGSQLGARPEYMFAFSTNYLFWRTVYYAMYLKNMVGLPSSGPPLEQNANARCARFRISPAPPRSSLQTPLLISSCSLRFLAEKGLTSSIRS
jgi:uncharacterized MAPEG superfamily protein